MSLVRLAVPILVAAPAALLVAAPASAGRNTDDGYVTSTLTGPAAEGNGVRPDITGGVYTEPADADVTLLRTKMATPRSFTVTVIDATQQRRAFSCDTGSSIWTRENALIDCNTAGGGGVFVDFPPYGNTTGKSAPTCVGYDSVSATTTAGPDCRAEVWLKTDGKSVHLGYQAVPFTIQQSKQ